MLGTFFNTTTSPTTVPTAQIQGTLRRFFTSFNTAAFTAAVRDTKVRSTDRRFRTTIQFTTLSTSVGNAKLGCTTSGLFAPNKRTAWTTTVCFAQFCGPNRRFTTAFMLTTLATTVNNTKRGRCTCRLGTAFFLAAVPPTMRETKVRRALRLLFTSFGLTRSSTSTIRFITLLLLQCFISRGLRGLRLGILLGLLKYLGQQIYLGHIHQVLDPLHKFPLLQWPYVRFLRNLAFLTRIPALLGPILTPLVGHFLEHQPTGVLIVANKIHESDPTQDAFKRVIRGA
mmetsp:Transcript_18728/g.30588  ORF Transcript_18728/g.30588 Transcript_18728/m.30588 type:complete len:284 (-) Transcript_18728:100-951(-)